MKDTALEILNSIVLAAGKRLLETAQSPEMTSGIWDRGQFKARIDGEIHEFIRSSLKREFPNTPVVSEEDPVHSDSRPTEYFLIDPIDGTASLCHGFPTYVTQIAFISEGTPVLSSIYAPALGELWTAARGRGAFFNDTPLTTSHRDTINTLIDNYPEPRGIAKSLLDDWKIGGYIECGSLSLKTLRVARGDADIFVKDVPVRDWDMAAPHLVLHEAGGYLCQIDGAAFTYQGGFERNGVIAGSCEKVCRKVCDWYAERRRKETL